MEKGAGGEGNIVSGRPQKGEGVLQGSGDTFGSTEGI